MTSGPIRDYRDLLVWQKAVELAVECEQVALALPSSASHLATQLRRCSLSVSANIAEGNGRFSRADYLRHLSIANGSVREVESHLLYAQRVYGEITAIDRALPLALLTTRLLAGLARSLRGKKRAV